MGVLGDFVSDWAGYTPPGLLHKGYKYLYGDPAKQQKEAAGRASGELRDLGQTQAERYRTQGRDAQGYYSRAASLGNRSRPTYVSDLYQSQRNTRSAPVSHNTSNLYGGGGTGPTQARDNYRNLNIPKYAGGQYQYRQQYGYGASPMSSRYATRRDQAMQPSSYDTFVDRDLRGRLTGPERQRNRYLTRPQGPTALDERAKARAAQPAKFSVSDERKAVGMADYGLEGRAQGGRIEGMKSRFEDLFFDPRQTEAIRDLYEKTLLPEGTTAGHLEKFYETFDAGDNPSANLARKKLNETMQRSAAARGGFVSGLAQRQEGEANAELEAQFFDRKAELAMLAQEAKQGRLRDVTDAALGLEGTVQDNRRILGDYARGVDEFTMGKEGLLTDIALAADTNRLGKDTLLGNLALGEDELGLTRERDLDEVIAKAAAEGRLTQKDLDDLAKSIDEGTREDTRILAEAEAERGQQKETRERNVDLAAQAAGEGELDREKALDEAAGRAGTEAIGIAGERTKAAQAASAEEQGFMDYRERLAKDADTLSRGDRDAELARDEYIAELARQASEEERQYYADLASEAIQLGSAQAATQAIYDALEGQAISETTLAAIELELKAAGVDAATRTAMINDLMELYAIGTKNASTGVSAASGRGGG